MSIEDIKAASRGLRGPLAEELATDDLAFGHDAAVLLKFHGIYQQDHRDTRRRLAQARQPLDHSCMVRASVPGGVISAQQWRALDRLAVLTDGSLRLTTRQGVQFHFVPKRSLRDTVAAINACDLTTLAACGDVVRNIMACPIPDDRQEILQPALWDLVRRFRPTTRAYWELWVDGDRAVSAEAPADDEHERMYGPVYLPRKFKIALGWPGDNCVDVLANDVGIVPTIEGGRHTGFTLFAGGGMGVSHALPDDTFPSLARAVAWAPVGSLGEVVESIVIVHRDHGDRADRQRARLKYLVAERGVGWLAERMAETLGRAVAPPRPIAAWAAGHEHHGWATHGDHRVLGLPVPNGRVTGHLRAALAELAAAGTVSEFRVTPRQDVLLCGLSDERQVAAVLAAHGVPVPGEVRAIRRLAIACPALPTCGQALAEAERVMPDLISAVEAEAVAAGVGDHPIRINMTGCANGCARPYNAEVGIVGRTKRTYDVHLGGSPFGDRLGSVAAEAVTLAEIPGLLGRALRRYAALRSVGESFGDFCDRFGPAAALGADPPSAQSAVRARSDRNAGVGS